MLRARAFTLIELLVVMAIIIILAALLLSAISHVKASAQAVACRNNLGQWGKATQLYAGDNDDFLPPEGWANPPLVPTQSVHTNSWYVLLPRTIGLPVLRNALAIQQIRKSGTFDLDLSKQSPTKQRYGAFSLLPQ